MDLDLRLVVSTVRMALSPWPSGNVLVTSGRGRYPCGTGIAIVCGHTPGEPIVPRTCSSFDWISPSCAGALPDVDADVDAGVPGTQPPRGRTPWPPAGRWPRTPRSAPLPPVSSVHRRRGSRRPSGSTTCSAPMLPARCRRGTRWLGHDDAGSLGGGSGHDAQADRAGAEDHRGVARVQVVDPQRGVVATAERLDQGARVQLTLSASLCSHDSLATKYSAAAPLMLKPKCSSPMTHSPTTRSPASVRHLAPGVDDLSRPFVAGDDRVVEGDDVAALEQVDVGVADADRASGDQHLVAGMSGTSMLVDAEDVRGGVLQEPSSSDPSGYGGRVQNAASNSRYCAGSA